MMFKRNSSLVFLFLSFLMLMSASVYSQPGASGKLDQAWEIIKYFYVDTVNAKRSPMMPCGQ